MSVESTSGASRFKRTTICASVFDFAISTSGRMGIAIVLALATAEAVAGSATSASCYDAPEYVFVLAVVMTERELRDVQRQILFADLVIAAHDSALQQRPKRFDIIRGTFPRTYSCALWSTCSCGNA
jgi:hypothetical protein